MTIRQRLITLRARGVSSRRIAQEYGIPRRTIEDWSRGLKRPPLWGEKLLVRDLTLHYRWKRIPAPQDDPSELTEEEQTEIETAAEETATEPATETVEEEEILDPKAWFDL